MDRNYTAILTELQERSGRTLVQMEKLDVAPRTYCCGMKELTIVSLPPPSLCEVRLWKP